MKESKTITITAYVCDTCGKREESKPDMRWYEFEFVADIGVRLFEKVIGQRNREARIFTDRQLLTFCSDKCATEFCTKELNELLMELKPPPNRVAERSVEI